MLLMPLSALVYMFKAIPVVNDLATKGVLHSIFVPVRKLINIVEFINIVRHFSFDLALGYLLTVS